MKHTTTERRTRRANFIPLALYPTFLGMAPVLGKLALNGNADPFTVASLRTLAAAGILWLVYLIFWRKFLYIYPAGLLGCIVVGTVNGIGSLFYYNGLHYLSASVAQLLNATYLIFVVILAAADGHQLNGRTWGRVLLAMVAVYLITQGGGHGTFSWVGVGLMVGNAILFAGTFILGQRVLYEMPSQTVALYVLTTMAVVVTVARLVWPSSGDLVTAESIGPILLLGLTTALSRLLMFFNVKKLGSLQTVLIGISETGIALVLAAVFLRETLQMTQWLGVAVLLLSLSLIRREDIRSKRETGEFLPVHISGIGFPSVQRVAFMKAFLEKNDGEDIRPEELEMIRKMMDVPPITPPR